MVMTVAFLMEDSMPNDTKRTKRWNFDEQALRLYGRQNKTYDPLRKINRIRTIDTASSVRNSGAGLRSRL